MIAIGTDVDLYEEVAYSGGIFNEQFWWILEGFRFDARRSSASRTSPTSSLAEDLGRFRDSDPEGVFGPRAKCS